MLINPPRVNGFPVVREERFEHKDIGSVYPPLSLLYMAAVLEKNPACEIKLLDANGLDISMDATEDEMAKFSPDVVISRTGFDTQKYDLRVLHIAKNMGAVTVLRSKIIADYLPLRDEILTGSDVDVFINSEPEAVVDKLCSAILENKRAQISKEQPGPSLDDSDCRSNDDWDYLMNVPGISFYVNGKVITSQPAKEITDIDLLPYPAYHLLPSLKPYHTGVMDAPFVLIQTTRGCPFRCTFCAFGRSICRKRSVDSVIREIKFLRDKYKIKSFLFFDDTISIDQERLKELAGRMTAEKLNKIKWACCTRANLLSYDLLKAMKEAGMKEIAIGIETGSAEILKNVEKGVALDDVRQAAKWCKQLHIMFYGLAIIGLPGETKQTVEKTVKFIKEIDPFYTQFCFATPFPNTAMYEYYEKNGLLLTKDWSKYFPLADEPVIRTQALTPKELKELRAMAYSKVLMRPMYLLRQVRIFDWKWNIAGALKICGRIIRVILKKPVR
jgi:radical SAM superfamily enzyme YgiQ (UPF0313 family)